MNLRVLLLAPGLALAQQPQSDRTMARRVAERLANTIEESYVSRTLADMAEKRGRLPDAVTQYRAAVSAEDALRYDEPPPWYQPVRHFLGAALLKRGDAAGAERVYREDLKRFPENGWSLFGLAQSLRAQNKDATDVDARFAKAWQSAEIKLSASRM